MRLRYVVILGSLLFISNLYAELYWNGRFYEHLLLAFNENQEKVQTTYLGFTILDLKLDTRPSDIVRIKSELEYVLAHKKEFPLLVLQNNETFIVNTLNATITPNNFKFTIGRFLPAWGKGKIFRPLDIFSPQLYFLNMLIFQGIDAFSAKYYISALSSIEIIVVPSMDVRNIMPSIELSSNSPFRNEMSRTVVAANAELHLASFDNNFIFLHNTGSANNLVGFACKGDMIIGLWTELFYSFNQEKRENCLRASIGADYSFAKYFFVALEYFYDESGLSDYKKYPLLRSIMPRMTLGHQYLMFDFNIFTYSELNYGVTWLGNLLDKSFVIFPYFRYEIFSNSFLGLSLYYFNGKTGREFSPELLGNYIFNTYLVIRF